MFRILIVDDEPAILGLLKSVLELSSFEPQTARSATEAKSFLAQQQFDVVLTDMRMETTTAGFEVVRAARQIDPRPVIAILTAFPMSPTEWRPSGADALMVKGADLLSLPTKLLSLLKAKPHQAGQEVAVETSQPI